MLILKRIYESRCVGPWPCEDFEVLDGDRSVGRILRIPQESEGQSWLWSTEAGDPSTYDRGHAASRGQALIALKARLRRAARDGTGLAAA
jgi:hypothetical protein